MQVMLSLEASQPNGKKYRIALKGVISLGLVSVIFLIAKLI